MIQKPFKLATFGGGGGYFGDGGTTLKLTALSNGQFEIYITTGCFGEQHTFHTLASAEEFYNKKLLHYTALHGVPPND